MKKNVLTIIAGAAVVAMGAAEPAAAQEANLLFGSTSASSSHYGYIVAVGQLLNEKTDGIRANVVETGAAVDNIRRMERGQMDLGIITSNVAQHAFAGTHEFEGRAQDLRLLWIYTGAPQNVVVRTDSGVTSLEGLKGMRFNPGIRGSATETTTEAVFDTLGLTADYVRGSTTDMADAIKDNRLAGYVKSGTGNKVDASTMDIATFTDIAILGLTPEQADKIRADMPDISVVDVPAGASDGVPAYTTWSFGVGVGAPSTMDDEVAYQIVKTVMENVDAQAAALSTLKDADLGALTMQYGTIPLHPGAARYYEEAGIAIPAKLKAE
ncbi:TAXI family TRAP transporter solute-binding subunit [Acuticoccus yangtzensis]|uniref:TAXI family TRAP transporter solute-binding subunit n=1 Tax=Acuticoccus yangtzensis TaxID=1443441 RepID=UPI000949A5E5|nr:TAXI family TRAP transporter solute-binding subunit [Acuticoccus yangtzensis]